MPAACRASFLLQSEGHQDRLRQHTLPWSSRPRHTAYWRSPTKPRVPSMGSSTQWRPCTRKGGLFVLSCRLQAHCLVSERVSRHGLSPMMQRWTTGFECKVGSVLARPVLVEVSQGLQR